MEFMLNSRPLSYVYTEENCEPTTKSQLLLEQNLQVYLFSSRKDDENIEFDEMKCKKRYSHLQKLINNLWKRFKRISSWILRATQMCSHVR